MLNAVIQLTVNEHEHIWGNSSYSSLFRGWNCSRKPTNVDVVECNFLIYGRSEYSDKSFKRETDEQSQLVTWLKLFHWAIFLHLLRGWWSFHLLLGNLLSRGSFRRVLTINQLSNINAQIATESLFLIREKFSHIFHSNCETEVKEDFV